MTQLQALQSTIRINQTLSELDLRESQICDVLKKGPVQVAAKYRVEPPLLEKRQAELLPYPAPVANPKAKLESVWKKWLTAYFIWFLFCLTPAIGFMIVLLLCVLIPANIVHVVHRREVKRLRAGKNKAEAIKEYARYREIFDRVDRINRERQAQLDQYLYNEYMQRYNAFLPRYCEYQRYLMIDECARHVFNNETTPALNNELLKIAQDKLNLNHSLERLFTENGLPLRYMKDIRGLEYAVTSMESGTPAYEVFNTYTELCWAEQAGIARISAETGEDSSLGILRTVAKVGGAAALVSIAGNIAGKSAARAYMKEME